MGPRNKSGTKSAKQRLTVRKPGSQDSRRTINKTQKKSLSKRDKFRLLSSAVEQSHEGIAVIDIAGNLLFANNAFAVIHGYSLREIEGQHISVFHTPEQMKSVNKAIKENLRIGHYSGEMWHVKKDGTTFPTLMNNSVLTDDDDSIIGIICTMRDISDLRNNEWSLHTSEETYRNLFHNSPVGLYRTSYSTGIVLECNDQFAKMLGYPSQKALVNKKSVREHYLNIEDREELQRLLKKHGSIQSYETDVMRCDGSVFQSRYSARLDENEGWIEGIIQDITAEKAAEKALQESESRMKSLLDAVPFMVYECDVKGIITFASSASKEILGYHKDEIVGSHVWEAMTPGMQRDLLPEYLDYLAEEQPTPTPYLAKSIRKDNRVIDVQIDWSYQKDEGGKVSGFVCIMSDITTRKQAQKALTESERRLSTLMNSLRGMVYRCRENDNRTMQFVSIGCENLLGYNKSEIESNDSFSYTSLIHPDDRKMVNDEIRKAVAQRESYTLEYRIKASDGTEKWVWEQGIGVYSLSGKFIALEGNVTDISRRKNMEFDLRDATRKLSQDRVVLEEKNIALNQFLQHMEEQKKEFHQQLSNQLQIEIMPLLEKLRAEASSANYSRIESVLENVKIVLSKNTDEFKNRFSRLSPREIEVSEMIAKGMTSKQISHHLNLSPATVNKHREIIRKKLELANKNVNLSTYLKTNLSSQLRIL